MQSSLTSSTVNQLAKLQPCLLSLEINVQKPRDSSLRKGRIIYCVCITMSQHKIGHTYTVKKTPHNFKVAPKNPKQTKMRLFVSHGENTNTHQHNFARTQNGPHPLRHHHSLISPSSSSSSTPLMYNTLLHLQGVKCTSGQKRLKMSYKKYGFSVSTN